MKALALCFGFLLLSLVLPPPASAANSGDVTVEAFYRECKRNGESDFCLMYVSGVMESMLAIESDILSHPESSKVQRKFAMCLVGEVSAAAALQAFLNWADKHPKAWGAWRVAGVTAALQEAWPCY